MKEFRIGEVVEVASPIEILETLDEEGTCDGLPFMPEMLEFCGRRFHLGSLLVKTCVEVSISCFDVRGFDKDDVWALEELRCSGAHHDGCGRRCLLLWKSAWLRKIDSGQRLPLRMLTDYDELSKRLKTVLSPGVYFCQCTQLVKATSPLSKSQRIMKCIADVRSGMVGIVEMLWSVVRYVWWKLHRKLLSRCPAGPLTRTPVSVLALQEGEVVEVNSPTEIIETLDRKGCNRGLSYHRTLNKFSGTRHKVCSRVERMISEPNGKMLSVEGTVFLEGAMCPCYAVALGGCPRKDYVYWREIWLKRIKVEVDTISPHEPALARRPNQQVNIS